MYPPNYPDPESMISLVPFSSIPETTVPSTSLTSARPLPCKETGGKQLSLQTPSLYDTHRVCRTLTIPLEVPSIMSL